MNKLKNILFLALVGFALASCVTARKVNYMQKPDKYIPSYADTLSFEDYVLRIGDRLYVYVYSLNEEVMKMTSTPILWTRRETSIFRPSARSMCKV